MDNFGLQAMRSEAKCAATLDPHACLHEISIYPEGYGKSFLLSFIGPGPYTDKFVPRWDLCSRDSFPGGTAASRLNRGCLVEPGPAAMLWSSGTWRDWVLQST